MIIFVITLVTGIAMFVARTLHEAGGRNRAAGRWLLATAGISISGVLYVLASDGPWAAALTCVGVVAATLGGNALAGWLDPRRPIR